MVGGSFLGAPLSFMSFSSASSERSFPSSIATATESSSWKRWFCWLDSDHFTEDPEIIRQREPAFRWSRTSSFFFLHGGCLLVLLTGWSPAAVLIAIALYWARMFLITAWYHRYFSHRTFQTHRWSQFLFALLGATCMQRGALWWAANHRHHHKLSDQPKDLHSPKQSGFWWSHAGWLMSDSSMPTDYKIIPDLAKYPELVWLNRFDWVGSALMALFLWGLGTWVEQAMPQWKTSAAQVFVWGFFISTTVLFHGTCTINSLSHLFGSRRFQTTDTSRNNPLLAIITLGEGWHNNHHFYQGSAKQGFYWWEYDVSFYVLKVLSWLGVVWNLHPVPEFVYRRAGEAKQAKTATLKPAIVSQ
jgi:stearoyl-CoA desaturase (Delta-9 desaturase)